MKCSECKYFQRDYLVEYLDTEGAWQEVRVVAGRSTGMCLCPGLKNDLTYDENWCESFIPREDDDFDDIVGEDGAGVAPADRRGDIGEGPGVYL